MTYWPARDTRVTSRVRAVSRAAGRLGRLSGQPPCALESTAAGESWRLEVLGCGRGSGMIITRSQAGDHIGRRGRRGKGG